MPETVATARRISQHAINTFVLLEYAAKGISKIWAADRFPRREVPLTRYIRVQCKRRPRPWTRFSSCVGGSSEARRKGAPHLVPDVP